MADKVVVDRRRQSFHFKALSSTGLLVLLAQAIKLPAILACPHRVEPTSNTIILTLLWGAT